MPIGFFEIEIVPTYALYVLYLAVGLIGASLGLFRWWLGTLWLLGPLLVFTVGYGSLQYDDINQYYDQVVRQVGFTYIAHNFFAPVSGFLLNVVGIGLGFIRRAEMPLD